MAGVLVELSELGLEQSPFRVEKPRSLETGVSASVLQYLLFRLASFFLCSRKEVVFS